MHFIAIVTAAAFVTMGAASPASRRAEAKTEKPECKYNSHKWGTEISKEEGIFSYGYHHNEHILGDKVDTTNACVFYDDGDIQQKYHFEILRCTAGDDGRDEVEFKIKGNEDHDKVDNEAVWINQKAMTFFQEEIPCEIDPDFNLDFEE